MVRRGEQEVEDECKAATWELSMTKPAASPSSDVHQPVAQGTQAGPTLSLSYFALVRNLLLYCTPASIGSLCTGGGAHSVLECSRT